MVLEHRERLERNGHLERRRSAQALEWMNELVSLGLAEMLRRDRWSGRPAAGVRGRRGLRAHDSVCGQPRTAGALRVRKSRRVAARGRIPLDRHCTICCNTPVIAFRVTFRPGVSLYEQVVYAAKKALVSGQLRPGDAFPSVRNLSTELRINPNTAHKVVTHLLNEGLLEVRPGTGTTVAEPPASSAADRARLLANEVEQLVVEAKKLGMTLQDVTGALCDHWQRLDPDDGVAAIAKEPANSDELPDSRASALQEIPWRGGAARFFAGDSRGQHLWPRWPQRSGEDHGAEDPDEHPSGHFRYGRGAGRGLAPPVARRVRADRLRLGEPGDAGVDDGAVLSRLPLARSIPPGTGNWPPSCCGSFTCPESAS